MSILVTGGAGYIGSHVVSLIRDRGEDVVLVDDLKTGILERVPGLPLLQIDLGESAAVPALTEFMQQHRVDAVIHFAARKQVPESVAEPARYYRDNLGGLANLLMAMEAASVGTLVFSSSAAVYGEPEGSPVAETATTAPINPYGETKLFGEKLIEAAVACGWLRAVSLRYFNVAGAASPTLSDRQALNLVPMVIEKIVAGEAPRVFGDDYSTPDGTCIRDFVHVIDLAEAHLAALDAIKAGKTLSSAYNIGTGTGSSVLEVVDALCRVSGRQISPVIEPRRAGDPAMVVADVTLAEQELGWKSRLTIDDMARSAWDGWIATH
ncbi:UDP-glucose 4-epimerase GalE [Gulosibacter bifidus]|uniref:UDP-glucose 4-epimerase n=1 Tax=Gulosibacter bifidus TaxID=272239 RepID=A0ABW5RHK7_9MICO|nr:UDP-glucose 4-epimerase GalE [Gulosibacter bifidus]